MFSADGSMRKTAKTKLFQLFSRQPLLKFLQDAPAFLIWGLSEDLHLQHLMIVIQRHITGQTIYHVINAIKCARSFTQGTITQQPLFP